jgi:DNA-binding response OmpR family regulator
MMLTAKATEMDKVIGFELGADDYLTKPFGLGEFLARIKALLRRNRVEAPASNTVRFLDFAVDFANFSLEKSGCAIHLSQKEFLLLKYLLQRPGQAVDKGEILDAVWGYRSDATTRTIDTHIAKLRRKLDDRSQHRIIQTVPTVGYKFVAKIAPDDPPPG